jgi:hypothetical protein
MGAGGYCLPGSFIIASIVVNSPDVVDITRTWRVGLRGSALYIDFNFSLTQQESLSSAIYSAAILAEYQSLEEAA